MELDFASSIFLCCLLFSEEGRKSGISRSQKLKREMNYGPRMVMVGNFSKPSSANSSPLEPTRMAVSLQSIDSVGKDGKV